jgi:ABC-2 type transport system permease protein
MKEFYAALHTEFTKVMKSRMLWATILFFAFIAMMMGMIMLAAKHPEIANKSAILSTKTSFISQASWFAYNGLLIQLGLVLGVLGPGIVVIWIFGREYSDRVIKDILALPVSRGKIVAAKFLIALAWSILLIIVLYGTGLLAGFAVKLDGWSKEAFSNNIIKFSLSSLMTIVLITPVAFVTSISRGYLLPMGFLILILIITQLSFVGLPGITPYFPWAIPGIYSGAAGPFSPKPVLLSYIILGMTSILGFAGTVAWWRYADQH